MRLRRKPWARPELEASSFFVADPPALLGRWHDFYKKKAPLHVELGCGKGAFLAGTAPKNPDINYLGFDIKNEVLVLAKRKIEAGYAEARLPADNVALTAFDIERIDLVLGADDPVERIYIHFPNPWPKRGHNKKRLTHTRQLLHYRGFLTDGGEVWFKTDDEELYRASLLYFPEAGFCIELADEDIYKDGEPEGALITEHERMFIDMGKPIYRIRAVKAELPEPTEV